MKWFGISDWRLGLKPRWFTGQQWANGTAQAECRREYKEKCELWKKTPHKQADRFVKWFAEDLDKLC